MKWNLENINFDNEKQIKKITSPRSKEALNRLGYTDEVFYFLSFKNFLNKYPNIKGMNKDLHMTCYNHYEKKRLEKLNEARMLRRKIIDILAEEEQTQNQNLNLNQYQVETNNNNNEDYHNNNYNNNLDKIDNDNDDHNDNYNFNYNENYSLDNKSNK
jgi:hypothetical protein